MRQIGTIADEQTAGRFVDYLFAKGIAVSAEFEADGWKIWVRNEDQLEAARHEFAQFTANPNADVYREARRTADELRASEAERARRAKKNLVNIGQRWRSGSAGSRFLVTTLLIAVCIIVAIWSNLGKDEAVIDRFMIDELVLTPDGWENADLWKTEPWRLVTPIFLHFGLLHLLFDMLMLMQLGRIVEILRGSWRLALFVLVIALPSNIAQYLYVNPRFGGMSGVVYGLFGYLWMKSRYEPESGIHMPPNTVTWMIGWFFLCLFRVIPNVANVVHGVGLVAGMILGAWPSVWRRLK